MARGLRAVSAMDVRPIRADPPQRLGERVRRSAAQLSVVENAGVVTPGRLKRCRARPGKTAWRDTIWRLLLRQAAVPISRGGRGSSVKVA